MIVVGNFIYRQIKQYRFNSIVFKNFIKLFCIVAVCLMLTSVLLYNVTVSSKYKEINASCEASVRNYAQVSDAFLYDARGKIFELLTTGDTSTFLYSDDPWNDYPNICADICDTARSYVDTNTFIHSVCIYSQKSGSYVDTLYPSERKTFDDSWLSTYETMDEPFAIYLRRYAGRYPYVLTMVQKTDVTGPRGVIVMNIDIEKLSRSIGYTEERVDRFITASSQGDILNDNYRDFEIDLSRYKEISALERQSGTVIGSHNAAAKIKSKYFDINYYGIFDAQGYMKDISHTKLLVWGLNILFIICSLLTALFASFETYRPIKKIMGMLDLSETTDAYDNDNELSYVAGRITQILKSNEVLTARVSEQMELNDKLYMSLLAGQIDTHFINNTINIINSQIVADVGVGHRSSALLIKLSRLLKNAYNISRIYCTVGDEVEYTKLYTELLQARYPGVFTCTWHIDDDAYTLNMPKMTLQPLIENSVYHGIVPSEREGTVDIGIRIDGGMINITVYDTGIGISSDKLKLINESLGRQISAEHIGINNIYKRFSLIYGENFSMTYESKEGEYTLVKLRVPVDYGQTDNKNSLQGGNDSD